MDDDQAKIPNPDREVSYDGDEQGPDPDRLHRPNQGSRLSDDGAPPAQPASDTPHDRPPDYPATDTAMDSDELYQEGPDKASGDNQPPPPPHLIG